MSLIVGRTEIERSLNVDLAAKLGVKQDAQNNNENVDNFIARCQNDIYDYVSACALEGYGRIDFALDNVDYADALKRAVIAQVEYSLSNRLQSNFGGIIMQGSNVIKLTREERLAASISPRAERIIENAGLTYRGALC